MNSIEVRNLSVSYGSARALKDVSIDVPTGGICAILGANGAGKSTLLKAIVGLVEVQEGHIVFEGKDVTRSSPDMVVRHGIALSPEGRRLFPELSVIENLKLGAYSRRSRSEVDSSLEQVTTWFPRLRERSSQLAGSLSGGEQQMCAIGRALMSAPKLLLLDEPSLGLAPKIILEVMSIVRNISASGITVVLVEQNAKLALKISKYCYVLGTGNVIIHGESSKLIRDPIVQSAYLGEGSNATPSDDY